MSLAHSRVVTLKYGEQGRFECEVEAGRILAAPDAPQPSPQFADDLRDALEHPLDFPPLEQAVIPDDHVVLALDRATPEAAELIAAVWPILARRGVPPENVTVIQPACLNGRPQSDPRAALPAAVRQQIAWRLHDPTDLQACRYLASTANGERVYLAQPVVDADVVVSIGHLAFDPVIGHSGTNSVLYPGLSSTEAVQKAHGQGHSELDPENERPLRQMIDEIGWLLGTQFSIQVIPAVGGGAAQVLAGASDSVFRRGRELLARQWLVEVPERPDVVVAAIERDSGGHTWTQIGAALASARNLVVRGGKIILLTELDEEPGPGLELLQQCDNPRDALKPLRTLTPPDLIPATQLATAVDWADVYLLSRLDSDLVEDLFMIPLSNEREARRALGGTESCVFLQSAQHTYGRVR